MNPGGQDVTVKIGGDVTQLKAAIQQSQQLIGGFGQQAVRLGNAFQTAAGPIRAFGQHINNAFQGLKSFAMQTASLVAGFSLANWFMEATSKVKQLGDEMFNLNVQMQRNVFGWQYMYFGAQPKDQRMASAQALAEWTKAYSYNVPFTRQDMIQAISILGATGMSAQDVENYMPMIADLAATQGAAKNMNMFRTAWAVQDAMYGMTRMLRMDLSINPEELMSYGFDDSTEESRRSTLMPALKQFMQARGEQGAARDVAHQTWFGAWSSFQDRIQNFQIDTGKAFFEAMQKGLSDFTAWWDSNQSIERHNGPIDKIGQALSARLAGAVESVIGGAKDFALGTWYGGNQQVTGYLGNGQTGLTNQWQVTSLPGQVGALIKQFLPAAGAAGGAMDAARGDALLTLKGFLDGLSKSGAAQAIEHIFTVISDTLRNPDVKSTLHDLGELGGAVVGKGFELLRWSIDHIKQGFQDVKKAGLLELLKSTFNDLKKSLGEIAANPQVKQLLSWLFEGGAAAIVLTLAAAFKALAYSLNMVAEISGTIGDFFSQLGTDIDIQVKRWNALTDKIREVLGLLKQFNEESGVAGVAGGSSGRAPGRIAGSTNAAILPGGTGGVNGDYARPGSMSYAYDQGRSYAYDIANTIIVNAVDERVNRLIMQAMTKSNQDQTQKSKQPGNFRALGLL